MKLMIKENSPDATVEQMNAKYPNEYLSFKVTISQANFKSVMDAEN